MDRDDDLAQTATSADSAKPIPSETLEIGAELGRYTIERMLGAGGMGVVYQAFDAELERRVALKVLRPGLASNAEHRLLREARSMAKLASPNVVAVYDVGTSDGRDYIAMELIDGETLDEWFDREHPDADSVIAAFVAAGRGLAAAHEASVIHRDFKPHNVLRGKHGDKVVVTDFGLARNSGTVADAPRTTPMPMVLTAPGSFLGTPAYMAPEQWTGGEITQATDQFAFCIALWEGLTGKRPFHGATVEELRACVLRGVQPGALDQLPRRVRAVVGRGLAIDPAQRWPSMHALLAPLERRRRKIVAVVAGALVIAALAVVATQRRDAVATCEPPAVAPAAVWGPAQQLQIRMGSTAAAKTLGDTFEHWQVAREAVCRETSATRAAKLDCLDRVLLRFDAIRRGRLYDLTTGQWGVIAQLYDPDVCALPDPPRMPNQYSEAAIIGLAQRGGVKLDPATLERAHRDVEKDPCAQAYFAFLDKGQKAADLAKSAAQLCGDDQAYGAAALNSIANHGSLPSRSEAAELREAERAVKHAAQAFLLRQYYIFRARLAFGRDDFDRAIDFAQRAAGGEPMEFELERRALLAGLLIHRARVDDLVAARREVDGLRSMWPANYGPPVMLDVIADTARWWQGDVAAANPTLVAANTRYMSAGTDKPLTGLPLHGTVVDAQGQPVANAMVRMGVVMRGDAITTAVPLYELDKFPVWIEIARSDAKGRFGFAHVPEKAVVIAQDGDLRSLAAPYAATVRLALAPTTSIRGHVRNVGDRGQHLVSAPEVGGYYDVVAPIRADGSFELVGVPLGSIELQVAQIEGEHVATGARIRIDTTRVHEADLDAPSARSLDVIVRSATMTTMQAAQVTILEGTHVAATVGALLDQQASSQGTTETARLPVDDLPPALAKQVQAGDVIAHARNVPAGTITVCAQGFNFENVDSDFFQRYAATETKQPVACVTADAAATQVVVKVPPMNRVD